VRLLVPLVHTEWTRGTDVRGALVVFLRSNFSANLPSVSAEREIRDLCAKVSSFPEGSEQFWRALAELRAALEDHTARLRRKRAAPPRKKSKEKHALR
jgi:hypothetical protein